MSGDTLGSRLGRGCLLGLALFGLGLGLLCAFGPSPSRVVPELWIVVELVVLGLLAALIGQSRRPAVLAAEGLFLLALLCAGLNVPNRFALIGRGALSLLDGPGQGLLRTLTPDLPEPARALLGAGLVGAVVGVAVGGGWSLRSQGRSRTALLWTLLWLIGGLLILAL